MPYGFYKLLHVVSAMLVLMALGSAAANAAAKVATQKLYGILHGVGILLMLVAGFGALAKLNVGFPTWVVVKIILWLALGAMLTLIKRMPEKATMLWFVSLAIAFLAVYAAIYKPFQ